MVFAKYRELFMLLASRAVTLPVFQVEESNSFVPSFAAEAVFSNSVKLQWSASAVS